MKALITKNTIKHDLKQLGVCPNDVLIVHSSLKNIGNVVGGPVSIILALEEIISEQGTLVMPTFTENLCLPDDENVTKEELGIIKENMPIFHKDLTPVDKVNGFLTEVFRKQDGVFRSNHPHLSFASWGKFAKEVVENHNFDYAMGEDSPLGKIYKLNGKVLLLGSPKDAVTALHLSEYSVKKLYNPGKKWQAKVLKDNREQWIEYTDVDNNSDYFPDLIDNYILKNNNYKYGKVGNADCFLFPLVSLIDFGKLWLEKNR
ncbi:AAC(3) family N-acetyltransferase [Mycoplasmatota bacterium]|nr:AAC(3) family N-acetyltransferase [Mycoplasmatota bacterium]